MLTKLMELPTCPRCGRTMKLIPAGVSKKTGKPYTAFYGCSDYKCGGTKPVSQEVEIQTEPGGKWKKDINIPDFGLIGQIEEKMNTANDNLDKIIEIKLDKII